MCDYIFGQGRVQNYHWFFIYWLNFNCPLLSSRKLLILQRCVHYCTFMIFLRSVVTLLFHYSQLFVLSLSIYFLNLWTFFTLFQYIFETVKKGNVPCLSSVIGFSLNLVFNLAEHPTHYYSDQSTHFTWPGFKPWTSQLRKKVLSWLS